jgi:Kelch motif protein
MATIRIPGCLAVLVLLAGCTVPAPSPSTTGPTAASPTGPGPARLDRLDVAWPSDFPWGGRLVAAEDAWFLVAGTNSDTHQEGARVGRFDPWNHAPVGDVMSLPAHGHHAAVAWTRGHLHILGGLTHRVCGGGNGGAALCQVFDDRVSIVDPGNGTTRFSGTRLPGPVARAATVLHSDRVYVIGGVVGGEFVDDAFSDRILEYDPAQETVRVMNSALPWPRADAAAVSFGSDILVFGGRNQTTTTGQVLRFDPARDQLAVEPVTIPAGAGESDLGAVRDGDHVYLFGGDRLGPLGRQPTTRIVRFDPENGRMDFLKENFTHEARGVAPVLWGSRIYAMMGDRLYEYVPSTAVETNHPPIVAYSIQRSGGRLVMDASDARDLDGSVVNYTWNLGGGFGYHYGRVVDIEDSYCCGADMELTIVDDDGWIERVRSSLPNRS